MKGVLKKSRVGTNEQAASRGTLGAGFVKNRYKRQKVALDALKWKSISDVDGIDDFEGFFGLEEVDDVEVVRQDGLVTFRAKEEEEPIINGDTSLQSTDYLANDWEGFSDVESQDERHSRRSTSRLNGNDNLAVDTPNSRHDQGLGDVPFSVLTSARAKGEIDMKAWLSLNLSSELLDSLSALKFSSPTPIQAATIPVISDGHDVIGKAQTGSGKTLAYGLPIVDSFLQSLDSSETDNHRPHQAHALMLAPTRELAHQIATHLTTLCSGFVGPRIMTITGGLSVHKQQRQIVNAHIIVATPGRLWEVLDGTKDVLKRLSHVRFLVIDEADRLLSQGHFQEMSQILDALDRPDTVADGEVSEDDHVLKPRQTLVFSATFHKALQDKLGQKKQRADDLMNQQESMSYLIKKLRFRSEKPRFIDVDPITQVAQGIREGMVECAGLEKDLYLYAMIMLHPRTRTLIFTNSISAVKRLTPFLQNLNVPVNPLHSTMPQKARLRNVERFSSAQSSILIATDVAARGLDIPGVQLILHYHLPRSADTYVHRSGRTARGDSKGVSILLCAPEETNGLRRLIAKIHGQVGPDIVRGIASIPVDRRVIAKLKPRVVLAKKLADVNVAKDKGRKEDAFLREAAEELGVDYDSEELDKLGGGRRGRGNQRKDKERRSREVGKDELGVWRAELRSLLQQRVNLGISERYIAQGVIDIDELLREEKGDFLGSAPLLQLDDV